MQNKSPADVLGSAAFDILSKHDITLAEPITVGLSKDKKFYGELSNGSKILVRISDISGKKKKEAEYKRCTLMAEFGIPMPQPVDFGLCNNGENVFQIFTWCKGEKLENLLPSLSKEEQYLIGLKAGEILYKIHSVPVKNEDVIHENWYDRYTDFINESIEDFLKCGLEIKGADLIIDFYSQNKSLLKTRPQNYLHGDFHTSNMLYDNGKLYIIDWEIQLFNSYGDPWSEVAMQYSPNGFSAGLINGYFNQEPPTEYWTVLALYQSIRAIHSIPWAFHHQRDYLEPLIKRVADVLLWYNNMNCVMPSWYS